MTWDTIVIGSGFGGTMAAHALVGAGHRVLMLERGGWVGRGPDCWGPRGAGLVTPHYTMESAYDVTAGRRRYSVGAWNCVGGQSVFYGGASYRFRESDFEHRDEIVDTSGAEWPFGYNDIEPFYSQAELMLDVAGESGRDEPRRSVAYPQNPAPLARSARSIADAARRLGLTPSRIPLAISYAAKESRNGCIKCGSCDGYACAADAKNDLASTILPALLRQGMTLRTNTVAVRLARRGSRVSAVECVNRVTGQRERLTSDRVILGAGTLATPHLLLASHLAAVNPAAGAVGRYLTRHRNTVVFGVYARQPNPRHEFDKQVAIFDFYASAGCIQQLTPPHGLVRAYSPPVLRTPAAMVLSHASGLLVIAEDQPNAANGVAVEWSTTDRYGLPRLRIRHQYSARDEHAAAELIFHAKRVLREAGARFTFVRPIETFSHALGTVRMGIDPRTAPLDEHGQFRGLDNVYVVDGSALPRSAGVNPSLTIAANALRIGAHIAGAAVPVHAPSPRTARMRADLPVLNP
jgi:choline dehydrogenase-like flavoprotein